MREAAKKDKKARFTALLHHITVQRLRESFYALKRDAAPGVDGVVWKEYLQELDSRVGALHTAVTPRPNSSTQLIRDGYNDLWPIASEISAS